MTLKQDKFIDEFIATGNASEAARRAGYSPKTANVIGSENLTKLNNQIQSRLEELESERIADAQEVLERLTSILRGEETDYVVTPSDAAKEAVFCRKIIADLNINLELPVFFEMTDVDGYKSRHSFKYTIRQVTALCKAFLENIKLDAGVYAPYDWLESLIDWRTLKCRVWNAQHGANDFIQGCLWQYTDRLKIGDAYYGGNILYEDVLP